MIENFEEEYDQVQQYKKEKKKSQKFVRRNTNLQIVMESINSMEKDEERQEAGGSPKLNQQRPSLLGVSMKEFDTNSKIESPTKKENNDNQIYQKHACTLKRIHNASQVKAHIIDRRAHGFWKATIV